MNDTNIFQCVKCEYRTVNKIYLSSHMGSKHAVPRRKLKCEKCDFTHIFPSKLKVHYNIVHLGIKRQDEKNTCKTLSCEHFGKTTCKDLETHSLFSCEHCQFSARRKHVMRDHVENIHEGIIHPCQKCSFVAKTGDALKNHMRTHQHTTNAINVHMLLHGLIL